MAPPEALHSWPQSGAGRAGRERHAGRPRGVARAMKEERPCRKEMEKSIVPIFFAVIVFYAHFSHVAFLIIPILICVMIRHCMGYMTF